MHYQDMGPTLTVLHAQAVLVLLLRQRPCMLRARSKHCTALSMRSRGALESLLQHLDTQIWLACSGTE